MFCVKQKYSISGSEIKTHSESLLSVSAKTKSERVDNLNLFHLVIQDG